jgi:hypothetical protein
MRKSTWIILGIVVILALIYVITKPQKISVGVKKLELPVFDQAKIDRIEIGAQNNSITLVKHDNHWFLELVGDTKTRLLKADQAAVESMLQATRTLNPTFFVSELESKQAELGLDPHTASNIKLYAQGAPIWSLVLGKSNSRAGRYAKLLDDKHIYVVRGAYEKIFKPREEDWRQRHLVNFAESELAALNFERPGKTQLSLKFSDDSKLWTLDKESFRADQNALVNLVRSSLNLRAQAFVDNLSLSKLPKPSASISFKSKDGTEQQLQIYSHAGSNYLIKSSLDDQIYEVNKNNIDSLFKPLLELHALNIMNIENKNIHKIIMLAKNRVVLEKSPDTNTWKISEPAQLPKDFEFDPEAAKIILSLLSDLKADRLANLSKDKPSDSQWQKTALIELIGPENTKTSFYATKAKNNAENYVVQGNIDSEIYIVPRVKLERLLSGLDAFKKL